MRIRLLGRSGLRVSELCLGTMTFGEDWGWGASREESRRIFERFAAAGGTFIDTAVNYTDGTSERFVGDFVKADREHIVVATKYTLTQPTQTDPNQSGNSRKKQLQGLHAAAHIAYGFPRDFLENGAREFTVGATYDKIDNHRTRPGLAQPGRDVAPGPA